MTEQPVERFLEELAEIEKFYTVFEGSSQEDVAYAKVFWNSLSLQPPIESRLVSADIRQRLKVAKAPSTNTAHKPTPSNLRNDEILHEAQLRERVEEKQRFMEMAKTREQILALLRKQREERVKKEMISFPYKPNKSYQSERPALKADLESVEQDIEDVRGLR